MSKLSLNDISIKKCLPHKLGLGLTIDSMGARSLALKSHLDD